ncbi:DUF952 domain-containing protein [Elusimicrobiota bacterium]
MTTRSEYETARSVGEYAPSGFDREGFIHCSYANQVVRVANFLYKGKSDLVLLEIDRSNVGCEVLDENLDGGKELFPHIYGKLPVSAVFGVHDFPCDGEGLFTLPADL